MSYWILPNHRGKKKQSTPIHYLLLSIYCLITSPLSECRKRFPDLHNGKMPNIILRLCSRTSRPPLRIKLRGVPHRESCRGKQVAYNFCLRAKVV